MQPLIQSCLPACTVAGNNILILLSLLFSGPFPFNIRKLRFIGGKRLPLDLFGLSLFRHGVAGFFSCRRCRAWVAETNAPSGLGLGHLVFDFPAGGIRSHTWHPGFHACRSPLVLITILGILDSKDLFSAIDLQDHLAPADSADDCPLHFAADLIKIFKFCLFVANDGPSNRPYHRSPYQATPSCSLVSARSSTSA